VLKVVRIQPRDVQLEILAFLKRKFEGEVRREARNS
jgi:hypothetical protein